jgi:hypothetical protein
MQRYEVVGVWIADGVADPQIRCDRCPWTWKPDYAQATLAELVRRAEEHQEACQ